MSSMELESTPPAPFNGLPDFRFFYRNLANLEVLAALRFGIEGRRGLILFTGDAGSGKSAVLHELTRALNTHATCILISDPQVRFIEVLRLILRTLEVAAEADDESALIVCCQTALRSRLQSNRIVSLAFDDAQHLGDEVIASLTRHFLGKGFDPGNNLLQIVLAGRPELRKRLFIPPLRSLDTQVEIECRLKPLEVKDIGLYITHRLSAAELPPQRFDQDAIERIAFYSEGRPGAVNALCERALRLSDSSLPGNITSDDIAGAARDLDLFKPGWIDKKTPQQPSLKEADEARRHTTTVVPRIFLDHKDEKNHHRWLLRSRGDGTATLALLVLVLLGVSAAWLHGVPAINYGTDWAVKLDNIVGSKQPTPAPARIESDLPHLPETQDSASAPLPSTDAPPPASARPQTFVAKAVQSFEPSASAPVKHPIAAKRTTRDPQELSRKETEPQRDRAKQISKAIENRAIQGIDVSVVDGIAYLDGRVATVEQKDAAERAARGVAEIRVIRNRIAIE